MSYVFISHSHADNVDVERLANEIRSKGFDVWVDLTNLHFGSNLKDIFPVIEGCSAFIVVMTPHSWASEWVQNERL